MAKSKNNLKERIDRLATLYRIVREVNSNLGLKHCLKSIIDNTVRLLNVERASLMLLNKETKELTIEYAIGVSKSVVKKARVKLGQGISGWVAAKGKPLLINDISKDKRFQSRGKGKYYNESLLSVPLKARNDVIGVLNVNNKKGRKVFTKDDQELLIALADEASIAVSNAGLYEKLLRANDRLKELDLLKSDFVANVSHELGTPLATCRYFTSLILKGSAGAVNDKQKEYLKLMDSNIERLSRLINNLLSLSRIEAGRFELRRVMTSVFNLSNDVVRSFEGLVSEKNIAINNNIAADLPQAYIDNERIIEVLTNLIGNAVKFSNPGGRISLFAESLEKKGSDLKAGRYLRVSVGDNGKGIPREHLQKIFQKFEQVDSNMPQHERGTGLGLAICKEIVRLHKGQIWAESEPGKGTTFYFTLPLFDEEEYFIERLSDEIRKAHFNRTPLSLVVLAISNFDLVKSKLSSDEIANILYEIESVAKKTVRRPNDIVVRFKKGDILAILADTDRKGAYILAERIQEQVKGCMLANSKGAVGVDFRVVVVMYPDDAANEIELMHELEKILADRSE